MKKHDLMIGLSAYVSDGKAQDRGAEPFALFFAEWLDKLDIPADAKYDFWQIDPHVPQLVVDAFEALRTGQDELAVRCRERYEAATGNEVPNLTEMGASRSLDQALTIQTIGYMLDEIVGRGAAQRLDVYANAQRYALQAAFDRFLRLVYRRGLYDLIRQCEQRGMAGKFGQTDLRTFVVAGRLMFTFARRQAGKTIIRGASGEERELPYQEISVSFLAEDDDPVALNAGIQSEDASLAEAMAMIEDVIGRWPSGTKLQAKAFKASQGVGII